MGFCSMQALTGLGRCTQARGSGPGGRGKCCGFQSVSSFEASGSAAQSWLQGERRTRAFIHPHLCFSACLPARREHTVRHAERGLVTSSSTTDAARHISVWAASHYCWPEEGMNPLLAFTARSAQGTITDSHMASRCTPQNKTPQTPEWCK